MGGLRLGGGLHGGVRREARTRDQRSGLVSGMPKKDLRRGRDSIGARRRVLSKGQRKSDADGERRRRRDDGPRRAARRPDEGTEDAAGAPEVERGGDSSRQIERRRGFDAAPQVFPEEGGVPRRVGGHVPHLPRGQRVGGARPLALAMLLAFHRCGEGHSFDAVVCWLPGALRDRVGGGGQRILACIAAGDRFWCSGRNQLGRKAHRRLRKISQKRRTCGPRSAFSGRGERSGARRRALGAESSPRGELTRQVTRRGDV